MIIYDDLVPGIALTAIALMMIGQRVLVGAARRAREHANWRRERRLTP